MYVHACIRRYLSARVHRHSCQHVHRYIATLHLHTHRCMHAIYVRVCVRVHMCVERTHWHTVSMRCPHWTLCMLSIHEDNMCTMCTVCNSCARVCVCVMSCRLVSEGMQHACGCHPAPLDQDLGGVCDAAAQRQGQCQSPTPQADHLMIQIKQHAVVSAPGDFGSVECPGMPDVVQSCSANGCKVLAKTRGRSCADYCRASSRECVGAWEEVAGTGRIPGGGRGESESSDFRRGRMMIVCLTFEESHQRRASCASSAPTTLTQACRSSPCGP